MATQPHCRRAALAVACIANHASAQQFCDPADLLSTPSTTQHTRNALLVRVADFNQDGHLDLALADSSGPTPGLSVYFNNTDRTFRHLRLNNTGLPLSLTTADFNQDDYPDLAYTDPAGQAKVLLNTTNETFAAPANIAAGIGLAFDLVAADLDDDSYPDLIIANLSGDSRTLRNNADNTFSLWQTLPTRAFQFEAFDSDLDGDIDLVSAHPTQTPLSLWLNNGTGTFAPPIQLLPNAPITQDLVAIDLNNDSKIDLAGIRAETTHTTFTFMLNQGDNVYGTMPTTTLPTTNASLAIGDVDQDGRPDALFLDNRSSTNNNPTNLLFQLASSGAPDTLLASPEGIFGNAIFADMDNDSFIDLVGAPSSITDNSAFIYFSNCAAEDCLPDLNNDGVLDNGDIGAFVTLFLAADLAADFNNDGILDNGDISAFVAAFLAGC